MVWDQHKVTRIVRFFERVLRLTTSRFWGKPFVLSPWEVYALAQTFGPVDRDGLRLIREVFLTIAKKNGKTELIAGLGLAVLLLDDEYAAEIYGLASSRDQAAIAFRTAERMISQDRLLQERLRVYRGTKTIALRKGGGHSFWRAISADKDTGDGLNPHVLLYDELHRAPDCELYDLMRLGQDAREQPLIVGITTAGDEDSELSNRQHEYARMVLAGEITDPAFLALIFEHTVPKEEAERLGKGNEWKFRGEPGVANSRETIESGGPLWKKPPTGWYAANPSLEGNPGGFLSMSKVESAANRAEHSPAALQDFRRYRLNLRSSSISRWIPEEDWGACKGSIPELSGARCWVGIDLSSTRDITAVGYLMERDGLLFWRPRFYLPDWAIEERQKAAKLPFRQWAAKGLLTLTPGRMVSYSRVRADIMAMAEELQIEEIVIDRWNAGSLAEDLDAQGFNVRLISQGYGDLSPACKELERMTGEREIVHEGNQIMDWMVGCTEVQTDNNQNIRPKRPNRKTSRKRIDGTAALVNAVVGYTRQEGDEDVGISILSA